MIMNYEEIIERLLDEKHITAKEAIYLLRLCDRKDTNIPYYPFTDPKPIPTVGDCPWITYSKDSTSLIDYDKLEKKIQTRLNEIKTSPCTFCSMRNVSYEGDSPCKNCTEKGRNYLSTIAINKENKNISSTSS